MKSKFYFPFITIAVTLLASSVAMAQLPQLFGYQTKFSQVITIKNTSNDSANDFHLGVKPPGGYGHGTPVINAVGFRPGGPGQMGAFKDTVFPKSSPPSSCYWDPSRNNFKVKKGEKFVIDLWGNGYDPDSTYLTLNGVPLSTNGLKVTANIIKTGGGGGGLKIKNFGGDGIIIQGLVAHINNTIWPFDSATYYPTGTPVPGIPNFLILNPGDSATYNYTGNLNGNWVSIDFLAAKMSAPGDFYETGAVAFEGPEVTIPSLSIWGLISLGGLVMLLGGIFVKRMV